MQSSKIKEVESFWNQNICGAQFVNKEFDTKEFFEAYSRFRYRGEWHLNELVPFSKYEGKKVLEIGCGIGADGRRFAENGAIYTGIDLTGSAVSTTKIHFQLFNLNGEFRVENVENMSFVDNTFDLVYAHGVLHHTANITAAIKEIYRVLKPNGEIIIMLYHKNSFNYYIRIMIIMHLVIFLYILARPTLPSKFRWTILEQHYINYLKTGKKYFCPEEFLNHCTDGPQCPVARAFTRDEVKKLFSQFNNLQFRVAHFPLKKYAKVMPLWFEKFLAKNFGWYLFVYGKKP